MNPQRLPANAGAIHAGAIHAGALDAGGRR